MSAKKKKTNGVQQSTYYSISYFSRLYMDVVLPKNFTCSNCTIRLLQHVPQWCSDSIFLSCADVIIISANSAFPCGNISLKRRQRNKSKLSYNKSSFGRRTRLVSNKLSDLFCYEGKCLNGGKCEEKSGNCSCLNLFGGDRCQNYGEYFM